VCYSKITDHSNDGFKDFKFDHSSATNAGFQPVSHVANTGSFLQSYLINYGTEKKEKKEGHRLTLILCNIEE